jgi:hypothetical protein
MSIWRIMWKIGASIIMILGLIQLLWLFRQGVD